MKLVRSIEMWFSKAYNKAHISKNYFLLRMVWNRDALSPLLYIMPLGRSGKQNKNDN
jgi:hypothetical protein